MNNKVERSTRQKRAIEKIISSNLNPITATEIHKKVLREIPRIGIATVYRTLQRMINAKEVQQVLVIGQTPSYEMTGKGHHHHFYCKSCNKIFDLLGCDGTFKKIMPRGFKVEGHDLTLYGQCKKCRG